jgi:hypothetical protein
VSLFDCDGVVISIGRIINEEGEAGRKEKRRGSA